MDLSAPDTWQCVDFISDLHLHPEDPATYAAWADYLQHTRANAVFILGDLFEVWIGDDTLEDSTRFEYHCVGVLHKTSRRLPIFVMHGNRDFLLDKGFEQRSGCSLIADPTCLVFDKRRWLLSHGDALCVDDHDYIRFRAEVRTQEWKRAFLTKPLQERQDIARQLRAQSEIQKRDRVAYADVSTSAALSLLDQWNSRILIHGHTHRENIHPLDAIHQRWVLSDWDQTALPKRGNILRLEKTREAAGLTRLTLAQAITE